MIRVHLVETEDFKPLDTAINESLKLFDFKVRDIKIISEKQALIIFKL